MRKLNFLIHFFFFPFSFSFFFFLFLFTFSRKFIQFSLHFFFHNPGSLYSFYLNFIKFPWFSYVSCLLISDSVRKPVRFCCYHFPPNPRVSRLQFHSDSFSCFYIQIRFHFLRSRSFFVFVIDFICDFIVSVFQLRLLFWSRIYVLTFSEFLRFSRIKFDCDAFSSFLSLIRMDQICFRSNLILIYTCHIWLPNSIVLFLSLCLFPQTLGFAI